MGEEFQGEALAKRRRSGQGSGTANSPNLRMQSIIKDRILPIILPQMILPFSHNLKACSI
jgi:hypothetical protein